MKKHYKTISLIIIGLILIIVSTAVISWLAGENMLIRLSLSILTGFILGWTMFDLYFADLKPQETSSTSSASYKLNKLAYRMNRNRKLLKLITEIERLGYRIKETDDEIIIRINNMIRNCYIAIGESSFMGDVYYNDDHDTVDVASGVKEYSMKIVSPWEDFGESDEAHIETFDGEDLGTRKIICTEFIENQMIIYLK